MTGDDGFLSRWSRRKSAARDEVATPAVPVDATTPDQMSETEPPVDLSALPPVDSLTANSDLAPFLKKGIPETLRNAAMRQMWESDPAIRDYIGPADYQWDFHTPGALAGFGDLDAGADIARMVADVTEYHLKVPDAPVTEPQAAEGATADADSAMPRLVVLADRQEGGSDPATPVGDGDGTDHHAERLTLEPASPPLRGRRRHGGAAPE